MRNRTTGEATGRLLASGRYLLGARLGGGGTADVYRALDTVLDRAVAVKLFRAGSGVRDEERFTREARLLAPLNHPGLVTIFDAGVDDDGQAYLVLQLVDGVTLRQRLARGRLTPPEVVELGARLASVLAYVHERGIVHRDVKPSNVLVEGARPGLAGSDVYLADFGISRLVDTAHITATGLVVGTVAYMAPEQVQGLGVGPPADVYSLGLVLLECVTGRVEFPGGNAEAAVARLARTPTLPEGLPDPLRWVLAAMTLDDPAQRLSARKCAEMLRDGGAAASEASTEFLVPTRAVPSHPVPTSAAPSAPPLAAVAGGRAPSTGVARGAVTLDETPALARRPRRGRSPWWLAAGVAGAVLVAVLVGLVGKAVAPGHRPRPPVPALDGGAQPSRSPRTAGAPPGVDQPRTSPQPTAPPTAGTTTGAPAAGSAPSATPTGTATPSPSGTPDGPKKTKKPKPPKTKGPKPPKTKAPNVLPIPVSAGLRAGTQLSRDLTADVPLVASLAL